MNIEEGERNLISKTLIIKHISNLHMQMNAKAEGLRLVCGNDRCVNVSIR